MDKTVKEFIERKNERKNSANAKLKLLIYGVKDNPEIFARFQEFFKEEHYAYDNGNWNVDKNRLTPSEILLPGGIVSKLHIRPDSPLTLCIDNNKLYIKNEDKYITEFTFIPRPNFWNYTTSKGTATKKLAQLYGFAFNLLWIPVYIILYMIMKNNVFLGSFSIILICYYLTEKKAKGIVWAIMYMTVFPFIYLVWGISLIYNLIKLCFNSKRKLNKKTMRMTAKI